MASAGRPPELAVLACADLDCDPLGWLGLEPGEAHLMTNAGGIVTDDALGSLVSARRTLGVSRIVVVHHSPCALTDPDAPGGSSDPVDRLRASLARLLRPPLGLAPHAVRGVLGDGRGALRHVAPPS